MKKKIIALAVAGSLSAPMIAQNNIYYLNYYPSPDLKMTNTSREESWKRPGKQKKRWSK